MIPGARETLGQIATWEARTPGGWQLVGMNGLPVTPAVPASLPPNLMDPRALATVHATDGTSDVALAATTTDSTADVVVCGRAFGNELVMESWLEVRSRRPGAVVEGPPPSFRGRFAVPLGTGNIQWWEGGWGAEWEPATATLDETVRIVSLAGRSSARRHPFALIDLGGPVLGIAVAWSGNWEIVIERIGPAEIELRAGLGDPSFRHELVDDEVFATPPVVLAIAHDGDPDAISGSLTRVGRSHWFARRAVAAAMPVEWNHWWPYEDKLIDESTFLANAREARRLGFDVAVLDAGWFGEPDLQSHWYDVRGDWNLVNRARFPSGIVGLGDAVRAEGLQFGLWCEIEAVGRMARLRSERPELLAVGQPAPDAPVPHGGGVGPNPTGRPVDLGYVCLGSPAARAWAFDTVAAYASAAELDWLKVDFNLDPGLGCTRTDHGHGRDDGLWAHVTGLYDLFDRLRTSFPGMLLEACSSGGLRWDHGIARHVDVGFQSDPDWPDHALSVRWSAAGWFPPEVLLHWCDSEWIRENPNQTFRADNPSLDAGSLDFIMAIAMMGPLGLSQRLVDLPAWARDRVAELISLYRRTIVPFITAGTLRRLSGQPRRDGSGPRWVGFRFDLPETGNAIVDPPPILVATFRLTGAPEGCPLIIDGLEPGAMVQMTHLLDDSVSMPRADQDGRLRLPSDLDPSRACLALLRPARAGGSSTDLHREPI
jgi:alpha-galactosidase